MTFTLYHLPNSRSQRIIWLLTELKLAFELIIVERTPAGEAPESLKEIHPLGKVPILVITEEQGKTILAETSAILDYFAAKIPQHSLFNAAEHIAGYIYYKNFADSSLMPNLALKQIFARLVNLSPFFARPITKTIKNGVDNHYLNDTLNDQLRMINNTLAKQNFLASKYLSGADILMHFMLLALSVSMPGFSQFVHIQRYLQDIENLPSYQSALQTGGFENAQFLQYWQSAW